MQLSMEDVIHRESVFGHEPFDWATRQGSLALAFPIEEYERRLDAVRQQMRADSLDCVIFYGGLAGKGSIDWLTGFPASDGDAFAVVPLTGPVMLTSNGIYHCAPMHSFLYRCWIEDFRPAHMVGTLQNGITVFDNLRAYLGDMHLLDKRIGLEGDDVMPVSLWNELKELLCAAEIIPVSIGLQLRAVKSPLEIQLMEKACKASDRGMIAAYEAAQVGVRESDLAAAAYQAMADGSDYFFHMMISSGRDCGMKHLYPRPRRIEDGDMVYVDLGVSYCSYVTDTTRTYCVGKVGDFQRRLLDCGLELYEAVVTRAKPGVTIQELQDAAFEVVKKRDMLEYYWPVGGFGHGIGTEISELPRLGWHNQTPLQTGNMFALEPMVTCAGVGCGVIEDVILITENGCRALTDSPRKLWK